VQEQVQEQVQVQVPVQEQVQEQVPVQEQEQVPVQEQEPVPVQVPVQEQVPVQVRVRVRVQELGRARVQGLGRVRPRWRRRTPLPFLRSDRRTSCYCSQACPAHSETRIDLPHRNARCSERRLCRCPPRARKNSNRAGVCYAVLGLARSFQFRPWCRSRRWCRPRRSRSRAEPPH